MKIRTSERKSYAEFYLTSTEGSPERIYSEAADFLSANGVQPILEKVYGRLDARSEALEVRAARYGARSVDPTLPCTYIEGRPLTGEPLAGLQLWGISRGPEVRTTAGAGRAWSAGRARFLYLPSVRPGEAGGAALQAERMFRGAEAALRAEGFSYPHVVRTWIYLARPLEWYGDFNRVRTACYREFGIDPGGLPASTGVQGRSGDEECVMDLLAVDPGGAEGVEIRPIRRARQHEPFAYGSAFTRAISVRLEGRATVYVSGTASVNAAGTSVRVGDAEAQAAETLLNVGAALESEGAGLEDICMATLFCRDRSAMEAFRRVARLLRCPDFPTVCVLANICRRELELELEAVAAPRGG